MYGADASYVDVSIVTDVLYMRMILISKIESKIYLNWCFLVLCVNCTLLYLHYIFHLLANGLHL